MTATRNTSGTTLDGILDALLALSGSTSIGRGIVGSANFTPAAAAYSAGDLISVAQEFAFTFADGVTAIPAGSVINLQTTVLKIAETAIISGETSYTLQAYSATPPSAQADNDAWTLASGDLTTYRGPISLGTPVDLGGACYMEQTGANLMHQLVTSSLWCQLITVGGFTATAIARQVKLIGELV